MSSMEGSVRLVFIVVDCMVADCKKNHKQRLHYFSGFKLFVGKLWISCLLFLFVRAAILWFLVVMHFLWYCKQLRRLGGGQGKRPVVDITTLG